MKRLKCIKDRPKNTLSTAPLGFVIATLLLACLISLSAYADNTWQGRWNTVWRSGGAQLQIEQDGNKVTGYYQPYDGYIRATIKGDQLTGKWSQANASGHFIFVMAPDKETFSGRFDNGEWWNGERIDVSRSVKPPSVNTTDPRETMRSFLTLANAINAGDLNLMDELLSTLDIDLDNIDQPYRDYTIRAMQLFYIIDQAHLRIWTIENEVDQQHYQLTLPLISGDTFDVQFINQNGVWKIALPDFTTLKLTLDAQLEKLGQPEINPLKHLDLATPRDTLRTFVEQFYAWDKGGKVDVLRTLDLSAVPINVREWETPIIAEYLMQSLNRITFIIWQEIPNDPNSDTPFVYFQHPRGNIVIAPKTDVDGHKIWQFTPDTIATIRELHDTLEPLPTVVGSQAINDTTVFFTIRHLIKQWSPWLTKRVWLLELWQFIAGISFIFLGGWLALLASSLITHSCQRIPILAQPTRRDANATFGHPCTLLITGSLWSYGFIILGIPDYLFTLIRTISASFIVVGGIWLALSVVNKIQRILLEKAHSTTTLLDDILITLVGSLSKLVLFISGAIAFAEIFNIPYETVIAGLGIGGLAFAIAAKDTIANFFGSAVILADRPFSPGDKIVIGEYTGRIEAVGLRSTKIRTENEAVVIIPNSLVSKDIICNRTRKQRSLVDLYLKIANNTAANDIATLSNDIQRLLEEEPLVDGKWLFVGAHGFHESGVRLRIRCYLNMTVEREFYRERHELTMKIMRLIENSHVKLECAPRPEIQPT
ncbi:small-conductance mechanosensitive channel [Sinobacterium caligoides]|uniref:Small-conductance mechanosensitive channel n=1 Tax=Sinobacterium caligoides TaxID=933926 RepID=A0A3N2DJZ5_9GAMM|nr:mechanosensitive ion channel family protein [Sinobacterium caligoides]ROS00106.1 small-conductance mechanosensitive channel [Sinobacterium caligoides]